MSTEDVGQGPALSAADVGSADDRPLVLSLSCRKCNLNFKKREQLSNHLQYFCQGGKYSDIDSIKKSVLTSPNVSLDSLRDLLSSRESSIGHVSLKDLRDRIRSDTSSFAEVKSQVLKVRQNELVAELRQLKVKHSQSVFNRMQQQQKVDSILNEVSSQRDTEIRSRIERERLREALRGIEQTDLVALEAEKRREVEELLKQQHELKQKENAALQEIERLTQMVQNAGSKDAVKESTHEKQIEGIDIRMKFARTGEELGRQAAVFRIEREQKLAERNRIMQRLRDPASVDAKQREELVNKLKSEQETERRRLEQLKKKLDAFRQEKLSTMTKLWELETDPVDDEKELNSEATSLEFHDHSGQTSNRIENNSNESKSHLKSQIISAYDTAAHSGPLTAETAATPVSHVGTSTVEVKVDKELGVGQEEKRKLIDEIEHLKKRLKESQEQAPDAKEQRDYRNLCPSTHQHISDPLPLTAGSSPLILQLQQQMAQTQLILQQHQAENARLYQELAELDSNYEAARFGKQRQDFESTLRLLTSKFQGQMQKDVPLTDSKNNHPKIAFDSAPQNSELYKIEMEYQAKLARLRYQKELQAEELELARIREQNAVKAKEIEDERRHAEFMAEQRRKLERQRMKQELAKDMPLSEFKIPNQSDYNPLEGLLVVWDFIYGLDKSTLAVKLAHQILDGSSPKSEVLLSEVIESQPDGPSAASNRLCIIATSNHFSRIPALPTLKLLVEVQSASSVKKDSIGWTLFNLFSEQSSLLTGLWKAPLFNGPMRRDLTPSTLASNLSACKHPTAQIFLRIVSVNESNIQPGGDPNLVMHLYNDQSQIRAKSRVSRAESSSLSRPTSAKSDIKHSRVDPLPAAEPISNELQPTRMSKTVDVGIGILSAELPSTTFARVRISIGSDFKWTSSYAQVGADGDLGIFRWEAPCIFQNCPDDGVIVAEVIARSDRPSSVSATFDIQAGESMLGWALIDVISHEKKLRLGSLDINLSAPPIPSELKSDGITIDDAILHVYLYLPDSPPIFHPVSLLVDESIGTFTVLPWIDCSREPSSSEVLFERGDGFDVYVDACRFLPDSVLISQVRLEMWTCELGVSVGGPVTKACLADGTIKNPKYDLRREYRAHAFNPTCTIEIIIEAIEAESRKLKVVGVAALNVFTVRATHAQPNHAQEQEFCLNSGNFQLPLHSELVRSTDSFLASSYSGVPKIPCATVLVRILPAPKSKDLGEVLSTATTPESDWIEKGLVVPAPSYSIGKYDSTRCRPSAVEVKLYNIISKNDLILVESVLDQLGDDAETVVQLGPLAVQQWIEQKFMQLSPSKGQNLQLLNMSRFAKYQQSVGLCIAVDGAWYVGDGKALPFVLYSLSPPGDFYKPFRLTDDVHVTGLWDWDSHLRWPSFASGYTSFRDFEYNEFAVAIIDVRLLRGSSVEVFGWSALQLFTSEGYVQTGSYQLPLIKGVPPSDVLEMLQTERSSTVFARELSKQGAKKRKSARLSPLVFAEPASVLVRLVDAQIAELGPKKNAFRSMQLEYVDWERKDKYECDLEQVGRGSLFGLGAKAMKLFSLKTSSEETLKQFETATLKTIAAELGIERLNM